MTGSGTVKTFIEILEMLEENYGADWTVGTIIEVAVQLTQATATSVAGR